MSRHRSGVRAVEHCRSFRATPGKRDDLIVQTAQADGREVIVGLEIEGGSGGPAQFYVLEKRLRSLGFRVVGARPRAELSDAEGQLLHRNSAADSGKAARADPVASCLERGHQRRGECPDTGGQWWGVDRYTPVALQKDGIRLFAGPWTQAYLDVLEGFPRATPATRSTRLRVRGLGSKRDTCCHRSRSRYGRWTNTDGDSWTSTESIPRTAREFRCRGGIAMGSGCRRCEAIASTDASACCSSAASTSALAVHMTALARAVRSSGRTALAARATRACMSLTQGARR